MTPGQQKRRDTTEETRREQQADEKVRELEQEVERLREAIADACFALDHSDIDGAKGYLLYALGEQDSRPALEENERLREAAKDVVTQIFLSSDGRTLDHSERKHLLDAGEKLESALDGGGGHDD